MIRDFVCSDIEKVFEFHKRILCETGAYIIGRWDEDLYNIEDVYICPGGCFIIIEHPYLEELFVFCDKESFDKGDING